jgi:hypothetical protein
MTVAVCALVGCTTKKGKVTIDIVEWASLVYWGGERDEVGQKWHVQRILAPERGLIS